MRQAPQQAVKPPKKTGTKTRPPRTGSGGQNLLPSRADTLTRVYGVTEPWHIPEGYGQQIGDGLYAMTPDELEMERAQMARERLCVTKADAAKMLSVSVSTINKMIGRGELPLIKIGTAARIRTKDIIEYVNGWAS